MAPIDTKPVGMFGKPGQDLGSVEGFFRQHPLFPVPFVTIAAVTLLATLYFPPLVERIQTMNMEYFGVWASMKLVVYAILCSFAIHGFVAVYYDRLVEAGLKVQKNKNYEWQIPEAAVRSSMTYVSQMVYCVVPFLPMSSSVWEFCIGYSILLIYGDAWFFACHLFYHRTQWYRTFHKTHHTWGQPTAFAAYFITSFTHMMQEHLCVIPIVLFLPIPLDCFLFYQYWGIPGAQLQHSGFELSELKLPFCGGAKLGHLFTLFNPWTFLLGSQTTSEHDFHHETAVGNYALSYAYLDKLAGTYIDPASMNADRTRLTDPVYNGV